MDIVFMYRLLPAKKDDASYNVSEFFRPNIAIESKQEL
jgi:hypothetical protein